MNTRLAEAIEHLKKLPEQRQAELAEIILDQPEEVYELSSAEREAVEAGLADIEAGRVVTEEEFFSKIDARNAALKSTVD